MKKLTKIYTLLIWVCCFSTLILAPNCFALEQKYPTIKGETITINTELPQLIDYFFNFTLMIGGIIALVIITIAGFRWMSSAANPNEKKEAMEQIKAGLFGLLIILASFMILSTINPELTVLKITPLK